VGRAGKKGENSVFAERKTVGGPFENEMSSRPAVSGHKAHIDTEKKKDGPKRGLIRA